MSSAPGLLGVTRPNFLLLTPACVSLGVASAMVAGAGVDWPALAVALIGALLAHVSVNAFNEHADFRSGLDFHTRRTPFSGGSGTLVAQPQLAPGALALALSAYLLTLACGLFLLLRSGWGLLPLGLTGLLIILFYSGPINRNRYLVLLTPGLGFGPLMVVGTHYALTGGFSATALLLSMLPFFLVNNLLLLNQIPDIEADRAVGRYNFAMTMNAAGIAAIYAIFVAVAALLLVYGVTSGRLPATALIGLAGLLPGTLVHHRLLRHDGRLPQLLPTMGLNVAISLITPITVSVAIIGDSLLA